jgi:pimeloyl-ACP methyl ester carboxylesterase
MREDVHNKFYRKVPQEQKDWLKEFRAAHPHKQLVMDGVEWRYVSGGSGEDVLLLLTGGTGIGEAMGLVFAPLESEYRLVAPAYSSVPTIMQVVDGIMAILETEGVHKMSILGQSFGGMLAQVIVRRYPGMVDKMVLSHTLTTSPPVNEAIVLERLERYKKFLKLVPFLPFGVIRFVSRKRIFELMSVMASGERVFWEAYFREMLSHTTKEYLIASYRCGIDFYQNYRFSMDDLADWPGRVLILESDTDITESSERQAIRELYPQAQVYTFRGTGHLTLIVSREEAFSVVKDFLAQS